MKKTTLSEIMKTAWAVKRETNITLSEALRKAWAAFKLKMKMTTCIVKFAFRKVDGTIREAVGTLLDDIMPKIESNSWRAKNYTVQTYYDIEKNGFRCFKVAGLL